MRLTIAFFVLMCASVGAQEKPVSPAPKCSTHSRQAGKPWTWLESNMCQADYDAWYVTHTVEINRPAYRDVSFWASEGIIAAAWITNMRATNYAERNLQPGVHYVDNFPYGKGRNASVTALGIHGTAAAIQAGKTGSSLAFPTKGDSHRGFLSEQYRVGIHRGLPVHHANLTQTPPKGRATPPCTCPKSGGRLV